MILTCNFWKTDLIAMLVPRLQRGRLAYKVYQVEDIISGILNTTGNHNYGTVLYGQVFVAHRGEV